MAKKDTILERFFLIGSFLTGLVLIFLVPPFQSPDENSHFFRAYQISEGQWMGVNMNGNRLGGSLPSSLGAMDAAFKPLRYNYEEKTKIGGLLKEHSRKLRPETRIFTDFPNVAYYAPFPYLPQAVALGLGRMIEQSPIKLLYLGRLAGLVFWIWMVWLGLRYLPFWKRTYMLLAVLPASLALHASLSGDLLTNALCFFLLGFSLHLIYDKETVFDRKKMLLYTLVCLIIALNKFIYAPLLLLVFLIPAARYRYPADKKWFPVGLGGLVVLTIGAWAFVLKDGFIPYDRYDPIFRDMVQLNPGVDPMGQFDFIRKHPFQFAAAVVNSYLESFPATIAHYVGKFGWEKNYLPSWMLLLLILNTNLSAAREEFNFAFKKRKLVLVLLTIGFLMMASFTTIIYMQWSPVGNDRILSLSGRYFFAIFPLFFLLFSLVKPFSKKVLSDYWFLIIPVVSWVVLITEVYHRYYLV
jgi:uncharacterized membrane protein